jgi:hypothetical protein
MQRWLRAITLMAGAGLTIGCNGMIRDKPGAGGGTGGTGAGSGGGIAGGTGTPTVTGELCTGDPVLIKRRMVRLSLNQIANSVGSFLGAAAGTSVATTYEIPSSRDRYFPPLSSAREGDTIIDSIWGTSDGMASEAGKYVFANFATATGCAGTPTDACAQQFLARLVEKAYRRPLEAAELTSFNQVYTEAKAAGGTVQEATQHGVYAALSAPQFLYRSEFGSDPSAAVVPLTPHEIASELSYFLMDGPPDQPLLAAAAAGGLKTPEEIATHVDRLLALPATRTNLQDAMYSYFSYSELDAITIDPVAVPEFTVGLRNAMGREAEEFLKSTLWTGTVADLLTSRKAIINPDLARIVYQVPWPAGAPTSVDTFVPVELPANRSGMLTQAAFLTSRARPDKDSVVARALFVASRVICVTPPAPPDDLKEKIAMARAEIPDASEREFAEYRAANAICKGCHANFDQYGLLLENFDTIARFRTVDAKGRAIDPSGTLPKDAGGAFVADQNAFANELVTNGAFSACMAMNVMKFSLGEASFYKEQCAVADVNKRFMAGADKTFSSLVREIALSRTLAARVGGTP